MNWLWIPIRAHCTIKDFILSEDGKIWEIVFCNSHGYREKDSKIKQIGK